MAAEAAPSADAGAVAAPAAARGVNRAVAALGSSYVDKCRPAHAAVAHSTLALAGLRASLARYLKQQGGAAQQGPGEVALAVGSTQDYRSCLAAAESVLVAVMTHSIVVITGGLTELMVRHERRLCLCAGVSFVVANCCLRGLSSEHRTCRLHLSAGGRFTIEFKSSAATSIICKGCIHTYMGGYKGKPSKASLFLKLTCNLSCGF